MQYWQIFNSFLIFFCYKQKQPPVFCKKVFLKISQNLQEKTSARASFLMKLKAEARTEFWEIFNNKLFTKHLWATTYDKFAKYEKLLSICNIALGIMWHLVLLAKLNVVLDLGLKLKYPRINMKRGQ